MDDPLAAGACRLVDLLVLGRGPAGPGRGTRDATDRTESFSDGVFAGAVTLLVLNLGVHGVPPRDLASALGHEWPHYVTFVVSFLTIGIIWTNHHEMFERIARVDRPLVLLNLLLLLSVTVIPFTTGLLAGYLRGGGCGARGSRPRRCRGSWAVPRSGCSCTARRSGSLSSTSS